MYSPSDYPALWASIRSALEKAIGPDSTNAWFGKAEISHIDDDTVFFSVEHVFKQKVILKHYAELLSALCEEYTGRSAIEIFILEPPAEKTETAAPVISPLERMREIQKIREEELNPPAPPKKESGERRLSYNGDYTFDNFIVGESNKFAHAAALAVANNPASTYNPLLFYGPSGLGKTHLMYAIINKLFERSPDMNAIYINGEDFTNQLVEAIQHQKNVEFREKYRKADVLLIDDIQFIAGKESTQEEFFHTFNALYGDHKQIIVTSDKPPKEMVTLEDRIRSRFEQGLMADIQEPDYELRLAILKKKAESMGLQIGDDILSYIAENLQSNIRQLEGIIKRISATHLLDGKDIDMALVRTLVPMFRQETESTDVTVEKILNAVQTRRGVSRADMEGKDRSKNIATARNMAMYIIRQVLGLSNKAIGDIFGNRDHSTVVSNLKAAEKLIKSDPTLEAEVNSIRREIKK